jgi:hypothetical protein
VKLVLVCQPCGHKGKYDVGRVSVDPDAMRLPRQAGDWLDESVCFTGYFRCRHCNAGGPWELTRTTRLKLLAFLALSLQNPKQALVRVFRPQLFDGTLCRTATQGEAHLQKLIEANPTDFFLWSRLGNLYTNAELPEQAFAAFTRSVDLNPHDVESLHSLACYWQMKGDPDRAADYFTRVLRFCRLVPPRNPQLWHDMVRQTLEELFELHRQSQGRIPFLPPFEPDPSVKIEGDAVLVLRSLDLSKEESWEQLTRMFLTGKCADRPTRRPPMPLLGLRAPPAGPAPRDRIGRNDRCPCGSGNKFKHCCGRGR